MSNRSSESETAKRFFVFMFIWVDEMQMMYGWKLRGCSLHENYLLNEFKSSLRWHLTKDLAARGRKHV